MWREIVLTAADQSHTSGLYDRRTTRLDGAWGMRTVRTEGELQVGNAEPLRFDSSTPRHTDPWSLRWQHAISSVPAAIQLDTAGRPIGLANAEGWHVLAEATVADLPTPRGASLEGADLLDPLGFVADAARTFPGIPPEGAWRRQERVAGVLAERAETCARAGRRDGAALWRCDGHAEAVSADGPQLHETDTWTEVWHDRTGLRGVEGGYSGTRVSSVGGIVSDQPIAAQRLVERVRQ